MGHSFLAQNILCHATMKLTFNLVHIKKEKLSKTQGAGKPHELHRPRQKLALNWRPSGCVLTGRITPDLVCETAALALPSLSPELPPCTAHQPTDCGCTGEFPGVNAYNCTSVEEGFPEKHYYVQRHYSQRNYLVNFFFLNDPRIAGCPPPHSRVLLRPCYI